MLIAFSLSRSLAISIPLLVVAGFAFVAQMASANTVLQTLVDDDKRGRVMALFSMAFLGVAPIGRLLAGGIATLFGAPLSLAIAGAILLLVSARFAWVLPRLRPLIRPIYQARGILPEIAAGLESTEQVTTTLPE